MATVKYSSAYASYFETLKSGIAELFALANEAKSKGLDPKTSVEEEIRISWDLADRVEYMVGPPGVGRRIRELSHLNRVSLAFKIAEEIVLGAFGALEEQAAAEQAVRTGLAILNEGVTAAPLHGIVKVAIKRRSGEPGRGGERYLSLHFAGPMRSAGGTELALVAVLGDYVRRLLGLEPYKATEEEVNRFLEELRLYEREVGRFQFHVQDEVVGEVLRRIPVEITGIKTDPVEVSTYRNVPGIETNGVRGGALRVVNDGLVGRAAKAWKTISEFGFQGWDWLKGVKAKSHAKESTSAYLQDIIAGRPVFSFPSSSYEGRFRLRYGRARNTGLACVGIHPATMAVLEEFIAVGTQLRIELPGKAGSVGAVDTIEGPVVRLRDGSVVRVETLAQGLELRGRIDKILFLGDLLISYAEFLENDKPLLPSSYVEEWWALDLEEALLAFSQNLEAAFEQASARCGVDKERLKAFLQKPLTVKPRAPEAVSLALRLDVPLHPRYCFFWRNTTASEVLLLRERLLRAERGTADDATLRLEADVKAVLDKLLVPHTVSEGKIALGEEATVLFRCLRVGEEAPGVNPANLKNGLELVRRLSGLKVNDAFSAFVGARMGRPEKSDARRMKPPVHVLFPVSLSGGAQRNLVEASRRIVEVEVESRVCPRCAPTEVTCSLLCPRCGSRTREAKVCPSCSKVFADEGLCPKCRVEAKGFCKQIVDVGEALARAASGLRINTPEVLKGVKGLASARKTPEPLEKGLLRAKHGLTIFKDGTIRFDMTNAPLTHFKPREVRVPVSRLRELGYTHDVDGKPLVEEDQLCELRVQDIIIPEKCAAHLFRVSRFIDELLTQFYGLPPYYNLQSPEDLAGHLVIGISPHTSAGVLGRIVGFSALNVCYQHPLWVSAKRRDCDGDEDSVILALDALLNFSRAYLPEQIGGIMDAPLLLTPAVNPFEVDDQCWTIEVCRRLPLSFFKGSQERQDPKVFRAAIDTIGSRLGGAMQFEGYGFLHDVSDLNRAPVENSYKRLRTMKEKLESQMGLVLKIEGVDVKDVAKKVLSVHLIRDIMGNLKGFTMQAFRCKKCNAKYRRITLKGRCLKCDGPLALTVYKGSVEKYLEVAGWLAKTFGLEGYFNQRVELLSTEIGMTFFKESREAEEARARRMELTDFM